MTGMLKKIAFCGLLTAACIGGALAQTPPSPKPSPSPSPAAPKLGTRAFTEAAIQSAKKARAAYADQCNTGTSLDAMNAAYRAADIEVSRADAAVSLEAVTYPTVTAALDNYNHLNNAYKSLAASKKDYEAEYKAEAAAKEALDVWVKAKTAAKKSVLTSMVESEEALQPILKPCPRHQTLIDAKTKADAAAKDANSKAAPKTATGGAPAKPADDCNKGGGLAGITEGIACQEGRK